MSEVAVIEHLFRHEYGRLVALLVKRSSFDNLDVIEDSVQWAMAQAVDIWRKAGTPPSPAAWLYKVAYRHLISELRTSHHRGTLLAFHGQDISAGPDITEPSLDVHFSTEISDLTLQMLFVTCHCDIPEASQMVFTLKSLCGFSIREIALRLFMTEANVYKRFARAKNSLKNQTLEISHLKEEALHSRMASVHRVLYLLFTEGYLSSHTHNAIRYDLCEEAIRLTELLAATQTGNQPQSWALLALMYFHFGRLTARQNTAGALLLLDQQDRSLWDQQKIKLAMNCLEKSASGDEISRYHVEAGIAAQHCLAPSFAETDWKNIACSYQLLYKIAPSPLHLLNRAIAIGEWKGAEAGLSALNHEKIPDWLHHSYHWFGVKADFYYRCHQAKRGAEYAKLAIDAAPTEPIKQLLRQRFSELL